MNWFVIAAQLLGIGGFALLSYSFMQKRKGDIFFVQIVSYVFYLLSYLLLHAKSGFALSVVHLVRSLFMAIKEKYKFLNNNVPLFIFVIIYMVCGIKTFQDFYSIFPLIAVILYTAMIWQGTDKEIRIAGIINSLLWMIYDIHVKSIGAGIGDIFISVSTTVVLVRMIKNDKGKIKSSTE